MNTRAPAAAAAPAAVSIECSESRVRGCTLRRIEQYLHQWRSWHDYLSPALLERLPGAHQGIRRLYQLEIGMALRRIKLYLVEFRIEAGQAVLK